jgi:preprotein translocase subunit SecE
MEKEKKEKEIPEAAQSDTKKTAEPKEKAEKKSDKAKHPDGKAKEKSKDKSKTSAKKVNPVAKYFKELRAEFKKVVWPTKKQVFNNTVSVVSAMIAIGLFVFLLDTGLIELLKLLTS